MSSNNAVASSPYALPPKKKKNKLLWIGLPVLILCIAIGAVVGGVVASRHSSSNNNTASGSGSGSGSGGSGGSVASTNSNGAGVGGTATGVNGQVYLAISTDSYMLPQYPTGVSGKYQLGLIVAERYSAAV